MPQDPAGIHEELQIYRNRDHLFLRQVERSQPVREIAVDLRLEAAPSGFELRAKDEDGVTAAAWLTTEKELALKPAQAGATAQRQLAKTGDTPFACRRVELAWDQPSFLPVSALNALRREALDGLGAARAENRPRKQAWIQKNDVRFPEASLTYRGNVLNQKAVAFYRRHGVGRIDPAAESGLDMRGEVVMRTRYCIKHQLGFCQGTPQRSALREPLYLVDEGGHRYQLRFDCAACEMEVVY